MESLSAIDLQVAPAGSRAGVLLLAVLGVATITDLRRRRIPNWLTLSATIAAALLHAIYSGQAGLFASLRASAIWLCAGFLFYALVGRQKLGAGDVKLMTATAGLVGLMPALWIVFFSFAGHVLWMMIGWIVNGAARRNFAQLRAWLMSIFVPRMECISFAPEGTSSQSPHAPFMLGAATGWMLFTFFCAV